MPHAPPLGALLRQYSAGSALTCDPVDQGLLNRGYRLATTRGDYFLKHHFDPETADPAAIARQHRATQRLADLGVPVAPPLPGRDGRTVAVVGGHAYALHPWIDGRHRHGGQLTTVQCGRLGALLGVVHASLERVMPTRVGPEGTGRNRGVPAPRASADREPAAVQVSLSPRTEAGRRAGTAGHTDPTHQGIAPRQGGSADQNQGGPGDRNGSTDRNQGLLADRDRSGPAAPHRDGRAGRNHGAPTHQDWDGPARRPQGLVADRHRHGSASRDQAAPDSGNWGSPIPRNWDATAGRNQADPADQHQDSPTSEAWDGPIGRSRHPTSGRHWAGPVGRHWADPAGRHWEGHAGRNQDLLADLDRGEPGDLHGDGPDARCPATGRNRATTTATPATGAGASAKSPSPCPSPAAPGPAPAVGFVQHTRAADAHHPADSHAPTDPPHAPSADPADTFALIDDLLAQVRRHRPTDAFDELARYRLLERRALLEQHADRRPPPGGSVGWVHGDFHPFNLLYKGDAPAAIVDWDRLGVQPRAEEAVRAAAIFFVRPAGTLDLAKTRAYARAYRRTAGATPSELAAAVHRVWWERLNDFWMLRWHYERGDTRADSQFPAASALAVWWTREYDAVCGAFTD